MSPRICGCKKTTDDSASDSRKLLEALHRRDKNAIISVVKHHRYDKFPSAWVEAFIHQGCVWSDAQKRLLHAAFGSPDSFRKVPELHRKSVDLLWREPKHMLAFYRSLTHEFRILEGKEFGRLLKGDTIIAWWCNEILEKQAELSPDYQECLKFLRVSHLKLSGKSLFQVPLRYIPILLKHFSVVSSIEALVTGMRKKRQHITMEHFKTILQHHPFDKNWEILGAILNSTQEKDEREYGFLETYLNDIGGNAEALQHVGCHSSSYSDSQKFMITKLFLTLPDLIFSNKFQDFFAGITSRDKYAFFYDTLFPRLGLRDPIQPVFHLLPLAIQAGNLALVKRLIKTLSSDEHRKGMELLWETVRHMTEKPWSKANQEESKESEVEDPRIAIFHTVAREISTETYKASLNTADELLRFLQKLPRAEQMWFAELWKQKDLPQLDSKDDMETLTIAIHKKGNGIGQVRIQPLFTFFNHGILLEAIVKAQPSTYERIFDSVGGIFEYFLA